ncbi:MAG: ABC transporter substrate-binding protein [Lachnospiraceae bacterium]|nr:ABC transporter substrate-binding protein [Lachnospiraceae bacterium]
MRRLEMIGKMMKKALAVALSATLALGLAGCGAAASSGGASEAAAASTEGSGSEAAEGGKTYHIGICNYVDDASLNQIVDNIESKLKELGKDKGVTFEVAYDNCNADANVMSQIIQNFITDKVDLMIGVATPVAMAMQAATEDNQIPVVFSAVSDPISTELVSSFEAPGANITGTSDKLNTEAIFDLMFAMDTNIDSVGLLYDIGQDASTTAIAEAKAYLEKKGVKVVERTGTTVDEVTLAAQALIDDKVDAVFTPTDNTIMTAELSIYEMFAEAGIPHYAGADSFALNGAFMGYGVNYEGLGQKTAEMAADILLNSKNPGETPVETFDNGIATVNEEIAAKLGYSFDEVKKVFEPFCSEVKSIKTAESF